MKQISIELEELVCPMCAKKVEAAIKKLKGVESVSVIYNTSKAKVLYDEEILDNEKIKEAIINAGYDVIKIKGVN